jgi:signal transduction histidine kinase/CheY-like chemotaxis protein/HPt (histidine-containing phosphotransfer) domain-containing protein
MARGLVEHSAVMFGIWGVVLLWAGVLNSLTIERNKALQSAKHDMSNLARAFEEHIIRSIKTVDQTLLYVRESYEHSPSDFDIVGWTQRTQAITDLAFQITLIDRNGIMLKSSIDPNGGLDLSDREHFRVHHDASGDELFISKPVLGRVSHRWSIQITRRLTKPDGTFDGVIVVSLDPDYLSRFYDSVDLGKAGMVLLAGTDGIVRAAAAAGKDEDSTNPAGHARSLVGDNISGSRMLQDYRAASSGTIEGVSDIDGVQRILAYRRVRNYPLLVGVGIATDEVLDAYETNRGSYTVLASTMTVLLISVIGVVIVRQSRLNRARRELAASEARYAQKSTLLQTTLEHMSQGIMMVDADRRVQVCNNRAIDKLGLPEALMQTRPLFDEVLKWQWQTNEFGINGESVDDAIRAFIVTGGLTNEPHIYERVRPDGRVLEIRSTPLPTGGIVRTYTDITLYKQTEAGLRAARDEADKAARAKAEFLATMSHEIRSPMSGLLGVLELLRGSGLDPEQSRMADMVYNSASGLLAVLNDILDFSKMEAGALTIAPEPTNLRTFISDLVQPYNLAASRKGVLLSLDFDEQVPPWINIDPLRLGQILQNLLSNAVKFTSAGTIVVYVRVTTEATEDRLSFSVRDSGIGISGDVMAGLFEPFTQADGSTTRLFGGTGLGLCISRRLAGMMGGSLSVVSELGHGSAFTLLLPMEPCAISQTGRLRHNEPMATRVRYTHGRVMVVDDDSTNRWLTQRQLERLGLTVDVAENGEAALSRLSQSDYDLLITDCHMPRMDGIALSQAIRGSSAPRLNELPIIGLTADVTSLQRDRCLASGMNEVLIKPIGIERMSQVVAMHLSALKAFDFDPTPVAATEHVETAVFDDRPLLELFGIDDPDGQDWLADYLQTAVALTEQLTAASFLSQANDTALHEIDRQMLADLAHRLAGASLSVGAMRLGQSARDLEHAALAHEGCEAQALRMMINQLLGDFSATRGIISHMLVQTGPLSSASI